MSGDRFQFNTDDIYDLTNLTEIVHWAAKLGCWVAQSENDGDPQSAGNMRRAFEGRLSEMPRNSIGGFHIFGDAAITAYTEAYVKYKNF